MNPKPNYQPDPDRYKLNPATRKRRKLPGIEVVLYDSKVIVHDLRPKDLKLVMKALPAMQAFGKSFENASANVTGLPVDIPDDVLEPAYPLLAACTDIPEDELRNDYALGELMSFLTAFNKLMGANPKKPDPETKAPVSPAGSSDTPSA